MNYFSPSDLLFQCPNPASRGYCLRATFFGSSTFDSISSRCQASTPRFTSLVASVRHRTLPCRFLVGMNTVLLLPLLREGLLTPFVLVRVGYDKRAFTSQFLLAPHNLMQIPSALRLQITPANKIAISLCTEPSLLINVASMPQVCEA